MLQASVLRVAIKERKASAVAEITGRADVAEVPQEELEARMKDVTAAVRRHTTSILVKNKLITIILSDPTVAQACSCRGAFSLLTSSRVPAGQL